MNNYIASVGLASVLDKIDQSLVCSQQLKAKDGKEDVVLSNNSLNQVWYEYLDSQRQVPYYHNYVLNKTQWEKPSEGEIIPVAPQTTQLLGSTTGVGINDGDSNKDIQPVVAYFSKATGKFSHAGSDSYWKKIGREDDKAGRQLGIFMDLSTLEANREEAKRMKEEAQRKRGNVDWVAYKEEKKNLKKRKHQSWVYEP